LEEYHGEDPRAVKLYEARTPLIQLKNRAKDIARKAIRRCLEERVAVAVVLIIITALFVTTSNNLTGMTVKAISGSSGLLIAILVILALIIYFIFLKRNKK
jgi:protein-S-isoprenylcysteine O-methyltransferase Ste14